MPSTTAYTPYETLAICQSVARHGSNFATLQNVSQALKKDEFVHTNSNDDRLSAQALQGFYTELVRQERNRSETRVNGTKHAGERSPKRRKLSPSPSTNGIQEEDEQSLVRALVDRLYSSYKEEAIKGIRLDEDAFLRLQDEIKTMQQAVDAQSTEAEQRVGRSSSAEQNRSSTTAREAKPSDGSTGEKSATTSTRTSIPPDHTPADQTEPLQSITRPSSRQSVTASSQAALPIPSLILPSFISTASRSAISQRKGSQVPSVPSQPSPTIYNRTLPPPSPQRSNHGHPQIPLSTNHSVTPSNLQRRPSPVRQMSNHSHGSPIPSQGQHPYPPYQQYPAPQWHPNMPPQHYPQHRVYGPPQYYSQPPVARHPSQTPQQSPYQMYPHTALVPHANAQGWRGSQYPAYPGSAVSTPISRPGSRLAAPLSGSSTPWRSRNEASMQRTRSPSRPERDVSPITDTELPESENKPRISKKNPAYQKGKHDNDTPTLQRSRSSRVGRRASKTPPITALSRSQSVVSRTSDTIMDKPTSSRRSQPVKTEPPSTPLPQPSDSEQQQRSSGRRGRPRNNTTTSHSDFIRATTAKRKRESPSPSTSLRSPPPSAATTATTRHTTFQHDPSLVVVSKNFSRTSQLLLSEITSHKLAGIFAKPLSDRDAPGYKDLVLRPQDLKSIKAAVSKGGRAALAAIEAIENDDTAPEKQSDANPPTAAAAASTALSSLSSTVGPIGNGFYLVRKTEELLPPKGIVNSSQLEMELVRMFANAVMFNPLPTSERGFGRSLRLRRKGTGGNHNKAPSSSNAQRDARGDDTDDDDEDASANEGDDDGTAKGQDRDRSTSEADSSSTSTGGGGAGGTGWDEGGIIADAREMFDDVTASVAKWRDLEGERWMGVSISAGGGGGGGGSAAAAAAGTTDALAGRHPSVMSASSNAEDVVMGGMGRDSTATTPVPGTGSVTGTARKRRRIAAADH